MRGFYLRPARLVRELRGVRGWADLVAKLRAGARMLRTLAPGGRSQQ